jgi:hypothetical protein
MSRSESEPIRPRYNRARVVSPASQMKPAIGGEEAGEAAIGLSGAIVGGAWGKGGEGTWETRDARFMAGVGQPIVARKRVMTVERRG